MLIALKHDDVKDMGVLSVGHRLKILKEVYEIKIRQDVPIESDDYVPPCERLLLHLSIWAQGTNLLQLPSRTPNTTWPPKMTYTG